MCSSATREIVTLQFGHYANFVGTHWWNIQNSAFVYHPDCLSGPKEINNDVLFREGENLMREVTYTPRLIMFDLKGSLNTLKESGTLYDVHTNAKDLSGSWMGKVTKHELGSALKNEFLQDLDDEEGVERKSSTLMEKDSDETEAEEKATVKPKEEVFGPKLYDLDDKVTVWSDFLRPHLHPKTLEIVRNYQHDNTLETFDVFGYGLDVYREQQEQIEDRLHFFAEECDSLEGFLLMVDTYNAFGGLSSSFLSDIVDDYRKKSIMVYNVFPAAYHSSSINDEHNRILNIALSYDALLPNASIMLPLSTSASLWKGMGRQLPHLHYNPNLPYHSSAILAANIDTITLPFRLETNSSSMTDMTDVLTMFGRKIISTHMSLPFPTNETGSFLNALSSSANDGNQFLHSLTPHVLKCSSLALGQYTVLRGLDYASSVNCLESSGDATSTANQILMSQLERIFKIDFQMSCVVRQPCKVVSPYPNIFCPEVTSSGRISNLKRPDCQGVESVPVMTLLQSSLSNKVHLETIQTAAAKLNLHKMHSFTDSGLEMDQFSEMIEGLKRQVACYDNSEDMCVD